MKVRCALQGVCLTCLKLLWGSCFSEVENWPRCDILISFFSTDFPLHKAIAYVKLRQPVCINNSAMQELLWDRRAVLKILDYVGVPSPQRVEVTRDGGPKFSEELIKTVEENIGLRLEWSQGPPDFQVREDKDAIIVDGKVLEKPFVEKPVSGEDHNIYIYFRGGGGRKLFRKVCSRRMCHEAAKLVFADWQPIKCPRSRLDDASDGWVVHL